MIASRLFAGPAILLLAASTASAQVMPLDQAAQKFGARPSAWAADLSPSGQQIVYLSGGRGASTLINVFDLRTKKARTISASSGNPENARWCKFASEARIVCGVSGVEPYMTYLLPFSRIISMSSDGTDAKLLGTPSRGYDEYLHLSDGGVVDWLPSQDGEVLMARNYVPEAGRMNTRIIDKREGLGVDQINVATLKAKRIEAPRPGVADFMSDGRGTLRVRFVTQLRADQPTGVTTFDYRKVGSSNWEDLGSYNSLTNEGMEPLAVDYESNSVYYLQQLNGRRALYRMKLDGTRQSELVAKNDWVDIDNVVTNLRDGKVIGYSYTEEAPHVQYFDPVRKSLSAALQKAMPGNPMIGFNSESKDGNYILLQATADTDAGIYYRFNRGTKELETLFAVRAPLEGVKLAPVKSITYKTSDGKSIPAYVTMSADGPQTGRPAVVLPHGGPSSRDEWGFDWLAQFLAARGYAVIQPNYRGSEGYGSDFLGDNAFRDWRTAISDIGAASDYLVSAGIADPGKVAILGWSYGGYAALQSAVMSPSKYKAVVAIAPVTDIAQLKQDARDYGNSELVKEFVEGGDSLAQGSPLRNASKIKAPVLLVHGDLDINVFKDHSTRMDSALRSAGTQVQLIRFEKLDHYLDDSDARVKMLTAVGQLLDRTIGK